MSKKVRSRKSCVDQTVLIKMLAEYLGKDMKLYAAYMNLEKACVIGKHSGMP